MVKASSRPLRRRSTWPGGSSNQVSCRRAPPGLDTTWIWLISSNRVRIYIPFPSSVQSRNLADRVFWYWCSRAARAGGISGTSWRISCPLLTVRWVGSAVLPGSGASRKNSSAIMHLYLNYPSWRPEVTFIVSSRPLTKISAQPSRILRAAFSLRVRSRTNVVTLLRSVW